MNKRQKFKEFAVRTFDITKKWIVQEFTGMRGKRKLIVTGKVSWIILRSIIMVFVIAALMLKLLLSIGDDD